MISRLQERLNELGCDLVVDGDLGPRTRKALYLLPQPCRVRLDCLLMEDFGVDSTYITLGDGYVFTERLLNDQHIDMIADSVCAIVRHELVTKELLKFFVEHESAKMEVAGEVYYDCLSRNGSSRGLTQFQPPAWKDARKRLLRDYVSEFPVYKSGVYLPTSNLLACAAYVVINSEWMVKRSIPTTVQNLYLSHNQGLGYWNGKRTNVEGQSKPVQEMING